MSMLKIYMEPHYGRPDRAEGGIRRVVEAQISLLPQFDVQVVRDPARGDVLVGHGAIYFNQSERPFVASNHGMYWREYTWSENEQRTNAAVVESLIRAQAVTVPSRWVGEALTRGMLVTPEVIYHGVDAELWKPEYEPSQYVLWNKARADPVSEPRDMQKLAGLMNDTQFVSTLGTATRNVKICGVLPLPKMQPVIGRAGVYLATARETFGIGTLEALACGVPVAGWDYGGQREIIRPGETGYLAPYGDYVALAACVRRCFAERKRLSENARADILARWQWPDKVAQYAALYTRVYNDWHRAGPKVSVIVTCYNLAKYLDVALQSVAQQAFKDFECLVVDDSSTDNTAQVAQGWCAKDARFRYFKTPENLKLSGARNYGFAQALGRYVINLDADDLLGENALGILVQALEANAALHIAYGRLDLIGEDGSGRRRSGFPSGQFNWVHQMMHLNQLHYAALMRREVWERSGGYREKMWRAEDAEFWCRVTSFGFRASCVTEEPTLVYRIRTDSKGQTEARLYADRDGYWNEGFPWHRARSGPEGNLLLSKHDDKLAHPELVPFSAPAGDHGPSHVQEPLVSVIIPVGPRHTRLVIDALDSLVAQTFGGWEAIVVNDSGAAWDQVPGAPYARVIKTAGMRGAGVARNLGLSVARAPFVFFLDADDWLAPDCLRLMLQAYATKNAAYIYSDWTRLQPDNTTRRDYAREYEQRAWLSQGQHAVNVLMAKADAQKIGGFDEEMPGWEDWDFFKKCAVQGLCGYRVPEALMTYRLHTGTRRNDAFAHEAELRALLHARYKDYEEGVKPMGGCCGGNGAAILGIKKSQALAERDKVNAPDAPPSDGMVRMQFVGPQRGPVTYHVNGRPYVGANSDAHRYVNARPDDVKRLEMMGVWQKVKTPPPAVAPAPAPQAEVKPEPPAPAAVAEAIAPTAVEVEQETTRARVNVTNAPQIPAGEIALPAKKTRRAKAAV